MSENSLILNDSDKNKLDLLKKRYQYESDIEMIRFVITLKCEELLVEAMSDKISSKQKPPPNPHPDFPDQSYDNSWTVPHVSAYA